MNGVRTCKTCRECLPEDAFPLGKGYSAGRRPHCRRCQNAIEYARRSPERAAAAAARELAKASRVLPTEQRCSVCSESKPLSEFPKESRVLLGVGKQCRECHRARGRAFVARTRAADPEAARAKARAFYAENIDHYRGYYRVRSRSPESRARDKAWKVANPERVKEIVRKSHTKHVVRVRKNHRSWREANREHLKIKFRARYAADPAPWLAACNRRRALKMNAPGSGVTAAQWQEILVVHDHRCAYCLCKSEALTMDHVIALSRGGSDDPENIVPACASCNSSKNQKSLLEIFEPGLVISQRMSAA